MNRRPAMFAAWIAAVVVCGSAFAEPTAIDSKLTTVPTKDVSDEIIAESVIEALKRNPAINAEAVEVTVANAVVRLAGAVRDRRAWEIAQHTAMQAFGAVGVDNQLMVAAEED